MAQSSKEAIKGQKKGRNVIVGGPSQPSFSCNAPSALSEVFGASMVSYDLIVAKQA